MCRIVMLGSDVSNLFSNKNQGSKIDLQYIINQSAYTSALKPVCRKPVKRGHKQNVYKKRQEGREGEGAFFNMFIQQNIRP